MTRVIVVGVPPGTAAASVPIANGTGGYSWGPQSGGGGGGSSAPTMQGTPGVNLGSALTIDWTSTAKEIWIIGTMNTDLTVTLANRVAGARARLLLDNTANHVLTITDGSTPYVPTIQPAPVEASLLCPSATVTDVVISDSGSATAAIVAEVIRAEAAEAALQAQINTSVNTVASSGTSVTLPDVTVATFHDVTLTANCTFIFPTVAAGKQFTIKLTQDASGSRATTWPASVQWPNSVSPTLSLSGATSDLLRFICFDGIAWMGYILASGYGAPVAVVGAARLTLLTSGGGSSGGGQLFLSSGTAAPSGPSDAALAYLKLGATVPAQVSSVPGIRLILANHSVKTPVQPWLLNSNGTLFGAAQSTLNGTPPVFQGATSFTVVAPSGTDFDTGGGTLWIDTLGYVTYTAYNASTHTFTGLDSRYTGTPSPGVGVYQVRIPRLEPGNTGTQPGATSEGQLNVTMPGVPGAGLRIAMQNLAAVESGGFPCAVLAWMV